MNIRLTNKSFIFLLLASSVLVSCSEREQEKLNSAGEGEFAVANVAQPETVASGFIADKLMGLDGNTLNASLIADKNVLLNYWATWCAPCIREIPSLLSAQSRLGDDFVVLLASDESIEEIQEFIQDRDFEGNFVKLEGYFSDYEIQAIPSTSLFSAQGEQIGNWLGAFEWDSPEIITELQNLAQ